MRVPSGFRDARLPRQPPLDHNQNSYQKWLVDNIGLPLLLDSAEVAKSIFPDNAGSLHETLLRGNLAPRT